MSMIDNCSGWFVITRSRIFDSLHLSTILNNTVEPESGVTILFNIVDNCEQCGQQNIVQSCFHQYCNNMIVFTRADNVFGHGDCLW